jgi:hypothetical protein
VETSGRHIVSESALTARELNEITVLDPLPVGAAARLRDNRPEELVIRTAVSPVCTWSVFQLVVQDKRDRVGFVEKRFCVVVVVGPTLHGEEIFNRQNRFFIRGIIKGDIVEEIEHRCLHCVNQSRIRAAPSEPVEETGRDLRNPFS